MQAAETALVLRRTPYGDSSQVLGLFTRQRGRCAVMARGVRKGSKSVGRGDLAGYHTLQLQLTGRENANMRTLRSAEIVQPRHGLVHDGVGSAAAQLVLEQLVRLMPEDDPHPQLFDQLVWTLDGLEQKQSVVALIALWQSALLQALGFGWNAENCAACESREALRFFSLKRNQTVCYRCGAAHRDRLLPVGESLLLLLQGLSHDVALSWSLDEAQSEESQRGFRNLLALTRRMLQTHGERPFEAEPMFLQMSGLK
uniref:DNA repair protein RecO n=1 Tax=Magnetococcus massalia (strain MO-1) TaxID=451514 RepID=A0A1S7LCM6_MAGMO|nr:putative DNA replication and repair protein RecO [Candidatus Magnetococcus massalia]